MKKLTALVLALIMVMSLATTAFADDGVATVATTYTLTINNSASGHTYEAYQIFSGDLHEQTVSEEDGSAATTTTKEILSNIEWGTGIADGDDLLTAIKAEDELTVLHGATDAASLAALLKTVTSDSATLDKFAEVVGQHLSTTKGTSEYADGKYTISGLEAGYYLVKDKDDSLEDATDEAYTKFILRVLKSTEVNPKSDVPTVEKTINDTLGGTYTEYEDFDITDLAYYKWEGTLPGNLSSYDEYDYKFVDTLPTGIVFNAIQQIYIEGHDGNVVHTFYDVTDSDTTNDTYPTGIALTTTGKTATKNTDGSYTYSSETANSVITLSFDDLFTLYPQILNTHKIIVKYTAVISGGIVINEPMKNEVYIVYSNNPNGTGEGKSTPDEAYAYSFDLIVDKYDQDDVSLKLEGAEFVLYYTRVENDAKVNYYAKVITEEMIDAGTAVNGVTPTADYLGTVYGWTTDKTAASILDTDAKGYLRVKGLDADTYFLEETKAPAGYNLMETPVQVDIIPTFATDGSSVTLSYKVDSIAQSSNTVGVRNSAGSTLPVTGGMGTTIFYVLGSIMVLGAVVLLITKKRMAVEN